MDKEKKLKELKIALEDYQTRLAQEMRGYRGVIHESAMSELKHSKVMVLQAQVNSVLTEIANLEAEIKEGK